MGFHLMYITLVSTCRLRDTYRWQWYSCLADICASCVGYPHSVVVYPDSTEDVVKIVNVARKYRMPVIPYSGGTSLEGHFAGVRNPFHSYSAMPPLFQYTIRSYPYLCSGRVGVYVSTCREWTRLSLSTVRSLSPTCVLRCRPDNLCFSEEDSDLVCQPGVGWMEINETLKEKGIPLFFPVRTQS